MTNRLIEALNHWPSALSWAATLSLLLLVAVVDLLTGHELSFFVFYIIPVSFAAWTTGLRAAVVCAVLATLTWLGVETFSGHEYSRTYLLLANALIRWSSYTLMAFFFAKLKESRVTMARYAGELESMVEQRTAKLQERVSELEMFSYSVSHNLRAPLRAVEGMAHLIEEGLSRKEADPDLPRYLREIKTSAVRMDRLVMDLVRYMQLTIRDPEPRPTYLAPVIAEAIEANRGAIEAKGARITVDRWDGVVWGESAILKAALSELVDNALRFSCAERKPTITIRVDGALSPFVRVSVSDNGVGIEPQHQARIFGLFEQLHSYHEFGGTGMGLAVAKKSIEKLGGRVEVQSEGEGLGSTFSILLKQYQPGA